jgi:hypothetical protein
MDVLLLAVPTAAADETLAFDGVLVRDAAALEAALSCLVGDFAGDCIHVMLAKFQRIGCGTYAYPRKTGRTRLGDRAWAGSIQALPLCQRNISAGSGLYCRRVEAAWASRFANNGLGTGRLCNNCCHHGFDKHAIVHGAIEVSDALHAAIVFARLFVELDTNPLANLKVGWARKPDRGFAAIIELDDLPRLKVRHYE